jgi:ATP-dependent RNA helicase DDX19/DBP5
MERDGHQVAVLHSALDNVSERDRIIDLFRDGLAKVLITTNVLARGIDVINTSLVINYDLPLLYGGIPDTETYLHRIGRTGRFGRQGLSISFVTDRKSWEQLREIQRHFGVPINLVPGDSIDVIEEWVKRIVKSNQVLGKEMGALGLEQSRHAPQ